MKIPIIAGLSAVLLLPSCGPLNHLMKSKPSKHSGDFIDFRATPMKQTKRSPWHYAAYTKDQAALSNAGKLRKLYVAPVRTSDLRPISKKLAATEYADNREEHAGEVAETLRKDFVRQLAGREGALFHPVEKPGADAMILELSLTELDPTSAKGNVTKTVVKYTVGPIASMGVGLFTGGCIAVEGRLREGKSGKVVMQFADKEKDKATIYNARDYMALGHAKRTAREWAEQFDEFLRTPQGPVKDSFFLTPMPY